MTKNETHVIVGAGLAGAKAAEALRQEGFEGRILLLGDEPDRPYERPPLSKDYLRGEAPREKAFVHPEGFYSDHAIELRTDAAVDGIDTAAREVLLRGGEGIGYDRLLLATGARPRTLNVPGSDLAGVHYLRDFRDADAIAARLESGGRAVIVGAGWIGAEVAASARQKGAAVTLVERGQLPLEHVLGPELGGIYADVHREHGVELVTEAAVAALEGAGHVERVRLDSGQVLECDYVVVGVGVTPRAELAERAGIVTDNGILASERLETSAPGVYAAGDVANAFHPFYGQPLRVEHWANALNQPVTAARAMLGKPASYDRLPYFFSDQYELGMEYTGYATNWDEVVFRGDVPGREFVAFWLKDGHVLAGMNVNVWGVTDAIKDLIGSRGSADVAALADEDTPLEEVAAGAQPRVRAESSG